MENTTDPPSTPDYYRDLGVSQQDNLKVIRRAHRRSALATHPDKNRGVSNDSTEFRKIQEAYEILSDTIKRSQYDRTYIDVQAAWDRYHENQEKQRRHKQERAAAARAEESRKAAEEERLRQERERRKAAEEEARREKLREEKARQAELRSREAQRKAWEERQRAAEDRIRAQKEAAAEVRSREVAERMRAEQERAAHERLRLARLEERQDAARRTWANLRAGSSTDENSNRPHQRSRSECIHPEFGWPKRNGQAVCASCGIVRRKWAFHCPECGMIACPECKSRACLF
ncbi:hypothetical protein F4802DRAFT_36943 [Xylaria palmicola]|nr:hypothetical protein F4802DRAFT_36943 [Xylaria palmicola]